MAEQDDFSLIDDYVSREIKPKLAREYISLAHTFSLLKRDPREAFENLMIIMFMAPVLVGRGDIARRNFDLLRGLVDRLERQEAKSPFAIRIIDAFYETFDSVVLKINKVQQVYSIDVDLSFLKELDLRPQ